MVEGTHKVLKNLEKVVPDYAGQGYELAGFAWFQGHKDRGSSKEEYEGHLVNLIKDLRKDLGAPDLPVVIGELSTGGVKGRGQCGDEAGQVLAAGPVHACHARRGHHRGAEHRAAHQTALLNRAQQVRSARRA